MYTILCVVYFPGIPGRPESWKLTYQVTSVTTLATYGSTCEGWTGPLPMGVASD